MCVCVCVFFTETLEMTSHEKVGLALKSRIILCVRVRVRVCVRVRVRVSVFVCVHNDMRHGVRVK